MVTQHRADNWSATFEKLLYKTYKTTPIDSMHQHSRAPLVTAVPAKSPRTNPTRLNNPRDQEPGTSRSSPERNTPSDQGIGLAEGYDAQGRVQNAPSDGKENLAKLSQVIQVRMTVDELMLKYLLYTKFSIA